MTDAAQTETTQAHKVDRLLDAIELIKAEQSDDALPILRSIIQEDGNFEDAWLWMSVAVDDMDQSIICLDNVLRINPDNIDARTALYRLRQEEYKLERTRNRLKRYHDLAFAGFWVLVLGIMLAMFLTFSAEMMNASIAAN